MSSPADDRIPEQEAIWQRIEPQFAGMSSTELWGCAGPPLREETVAAGASMMTYRRADLKTADLKKYCQVTLVLEGGKVRVFSADHSAPEFVSAGRL